ncbi:MAG TPA: hypothetical protein VJA23_01240 [Candidatus Nanoarchaeia archaeon]|nr:hypothetical protein [Candidatus Nanoarchaeia archaeon]
MATITINIDNQTETIFREAVKEELGTEKGKLGQAVNEALQLWINKKKQEEISQRQLTLLKTGFKLGKWKFNRDELHERTN